MANLPIPVICECGFNTMDAKEAMKHARKHEEERKMRGLDDYIMGTHIYEEDIVQHRCPTCKRESMIPMFYELGGWFYLDVEGYCENCDKEMELIETP